jgi:hypothetical protein
MGPIIGAGAARFIPIEVGKGNFEVAKRWMKRSRPVDSMRAYGAVGDLVPMDSRAIAIESVLKPWRIGSLVTPMIMAKTLRDG